jgi:hypothetical protein
MKSALRFSILGCLLMAVAAAPASLSLLAPGVAQGSPALALITGTVKDEGGTPLAGAIVALLEANLGGKEIKSVKTDAAGKFTASVTPGSYRLRAEAEGFKPVLARVTLDPADKLTYNFLLKRTDTLVEKRGDREDLRWIGRSVPRSILHVQDPDVVAEDKPAVDKVEDRFSQPRPSFHGVAQFFAASSPSHFGRGFFGTNFAVSGSLGGNLEMALIGQSGLGRYAPQRLAAITTMRPSANHQVTASIGYGQLPIANPLPSDNGLLLELDAPHVPGEAARVGRLGQISAPMTAPAAAGNTATPRSLNQVSLSAVDAWQVFRPLLIIYGFDYSRFVGSAARHGESLLPRLAVQFTPSSRTRINAAITPGASDGSEAVESFDSEGIHAPFETRPAEVAYGETPILDRSRRFEFGIERLFGDGSSSLEATAFYDVVSGHGVGVLALPLEASPETQAAIQQVAHQVAAMNGASRGLRVIYARRLNNYVQASVGYSFGRGEQFNQIGQAGLERLTPARLFTGGFFQVASAKLDLDLPQTGTRVSTVVRLSPSAVVFAIDPFAGRMSVYDPNINIYVTQDLPSFGLPLRWQAIVDIRNLLNQTNGVEDGTAQLIAVRTQRTVRGGIAFRW